MWKLSLEFKRSKPAWCENIVKNYVKPGGTLVHTGDPCSVGRVANRSSRTVIVQINFSNLEFSLSMSTISSSDKFCTSFNASKGWNLRFNWFYANTLSIVSGQSADTTKEDINMMSILPFYLLFHPNLCRVHHDATVARL